MAESGRRALRSPWNRRDAASRELGQVRRAIAEQAVEGQLPEPELVTEYRRVLEMFESAHADWLASRDHRPAAPAGPSLPRDSSA